jgi:catechol 2,3-dioxygenase-like lactoylglutathione lyase family enzyme
MQCRFKVAASFAALSLIFGLALTAAAQLPDKPPLRPKIIGISHIAVYTSNPAAAEHFYVDVLGAVKQTDPESPKGVRYAFSAAQFVEVRPLPEGAGINRLDHTAWNTDDAEAMRRYLSSKAWKVPGQVEKGADGSRWFTTSDPEGNKVQFVQLPPHPRQVVAPNAIGHHIIHVGFMVHNRAVEDTFYRDLLNFKPYWYGGMVENRVDWVSQQAPESHDWLEYMLTHGSTPLSESKGIPAGMSQHDLGVLDHFSIGVDSVDVAFKTLKDAGRLNGVDAQAHTQMGRDGKGQFNLFDPDGIRVELMNFHATEKPCCSSFTADDPAE